MTRMTKQMLLDENARLRAHCDLVEGQRDSALSLNQNLLGEINIQEEQLANLRSEINNLRLRASTLQNASDSSYKKASVGSSADIGKPFMMGGQMVQKYRVSDKIVAYRPVGH